MLALEEVMEKAMEEATAWAIIAAHITPVLTGMVGCTMATATAPVGDSPYLRYKRKKVSTIPPAIIAGGIVL